MTDNHQNLELSGYTAPVPFDLDSLLSDTNRVELTNTSEETSPRTFEEWCEIHGEPEYLCESRVLKPSEIIVEEHIEEPVEIDTSNIILEDKNGTQKLNYKEFVDVFAALNNCVFHNGVFYNPNGEINPQTVRRDIANSLGGMGWTSRLDVPTTAIFTSLRDMYSVEELPVNDKVIPLANGDLHIDGEQWVFCLGEKKHSPYRLAVNYTPVSRPMPLFNKWINDAFDPEDIITIQEIMGYCLVPSTAAGEAFIIVGDGETGKSGLGTILMKLLGNSAISMETQDLVTKRFQIASVENKLLAYDDDLGSAALTDTNLFKKLITADTPIRAERKYADPHEFMSYARIIASANFMLTSLYDDSNGFYRRLHPILIKPKPKDRKIIRKYYDMIVAEEKAQILKWSLEGLRRVIANGWKIHWSQRSIDYMKMSKSNTTHFEDFFSETCEVTRDGENATIREITEVYKKWCRENGAKHLSERRVSNWFSDNAERIGVHRSNNIVRNGKRVRGYNNLKIKDEWKNTVVL